MYEQAHRRLGDGRLEDYKRPPPPTEAFFPPVQPAAPPKQRWSVERLAAMEALWGAGFTGPGGAPETLRLARPIGLNSHASLLLLGGGLGGPAQAIVDTFGSWVVSFEADADIAELAEQRRVTLPNARRMQVMGWNRADPTFGLHTAQHAMALEAGRGTPLDGMLAGVAAALRPHGHVVVTELVAEGAAPEADREFAAWCRLENRLPTLPRLGDVTAALARLHFDVRVVEDLSDRHVSATLAGWHGAVKKLGSGPKPDFRAAAAFVTEAELWMLRIRLMRRFGLRLVKWHAVGTA